MKKAYKNIVFFCGLMFFAIEVRAQQATQYSLFMLHPFGFNPAMSSVESDIILTGVNRQQWSGLLGRPKSSMLSVQVPIPYVKGGFGILFEKDIIGASGSNKVELSYSQSVALGGNNFLSIGAAIGLNLYELDGAKLRTPEGVYVGGNIFHSDDKLSSSLLQTRALTNAFGCHLSTNIVHIGIGVSNLLPTKADLSIVSVEYKRTFFGYLTKTFDLQNFKLTPSVLAKSNGTVSQIEAALQARYAQVTIGVGYRGYSTYTSDAMNFMAGYHLTDNLLVAYCYDLGVSKLKDVHNGSHEIMLKYNLRNIISTGIYPKVIYNPRFL